jgi:hypothetical protein
MNRKKKDDRWCQRISRHIGTGISRNNDSVCPYAAAIPF